MTDNIKLFLENNAYLLDEDVELFIDHAYEQLSNIETHDLMYLLSEADIDIKNQVEEFIKAYVRKNISNFVDENLDNFIEDIPCFHKTKYELEDIVMEIGDDEGYDFPSDEHNVFWIEERT